MQPFITDLRTLVDDLKARRWLDALGDSKTVYVTLAEMIGQFFVATHDNTVTAEDYDELKKAIHELQAEHDNLRPAQNSLANSPDLHYAFQPALVMEAIAVILKLLTMFQKKAATHIALDGE